MGFKNNFAFINKLLNTVNTTTDPTSLLSFKYFYEPTASEFNCVIWIVNLIITVLLILISIYIVSASIYHEVRIEKRRTQHMYIMLIEDKYGFYTKVISILIGFVSLKSNLNSMGFLWVEFVVSTLNVTLYTNESYEIDLNLKLACKVLPVTGDLFVWMGVCLILLFMWFRIQIFYIHPRTSVYSRSAEK